MPDLQFHFSPGWSVGYGTQQPAGHGFAFWPALLRPESHGYLRLRSRDPFTPPLIQPNYLACAADIDVLEQGILIARHPHAGFIETPHPLSKPSERADGRRDDRGLCLPVCPLPRPE